MYGFYSIVDEDNTQSHRQLTIVKIQDLWHSSLMHILPRHEPANIFHILIVEFDYIFALI
jgi:hypothetical protein